MLTKEEIDELRPAILAEPEGSPARLLLEHIDEVRANQTARSRSEALDICRRQGRSAEEAEKIVAAFEAGQTVPMETVKCWVCEGWGFVQTPGCMGSNSGECPQCHGSQRSTRFKVPA
jgi:hypothetical protein